MFEVVDGIWVNQQNTNVLLVFLHEKRNVILRLTYYSI